MLLWDWHSTDSSQSGVVNLGFSLALFAVRVVGTIYLIYKSDLRTGLLKKRIRVFEIGWKTKMEGGCEQNCLLIRANPSE
jgi:hypothetical protein